MNQSERLGFSIVLCTYNGEARLSPTLTYLASLTVPSGCAVELLLIDNASTDNTAIFTEATWHELDNPFPLRVLQETRPGKGYAVETGYDAAQYSYILTVDDDNWLDSQYLLKSVELFTQYPDVGILQGHSEVVFEAAPPAWFADFRMAKQLVVGGPIDEPGYFPREHFHIWGAGLVMYRRDWLELRQRGFSFLTSKVPGKAAGEDSELGLGLSLLGRRAYYSDELKFKHFMPAGRLRWNKLKQNFNTFGHVSYYLNMYAAVIGAIEDGKPLRPSAVKRFILRSAFRQLRLLTPKQHVAFWIMPKEEYYQLLLTEYYARIRAVGLLSATLQQDTDLIEHWIRPLLEERKKGAQ